MQKQVTLRTGGEYVQRCPHVCSSQLQYNNWLGGLLMFCEQVQQAGGNIKRRKKRLLFPFLSGIFCCGWTRKPFVD